MFSNFLNEYQPNNKIINAFQLACFQLPVSRIQKRHFSNGSLLPHGLREVQINTMFWVLIQSINSLTPLFSVELIKSCWPLLDSVLYFSLTSSQRCSILLTSLSPLPGLQGYFPPLTPVNAHSFHSHSWINASTQRVSALPKPYSSSTELQQ